MFDTEAFIRCVEEHPALWDRHVPEYKDLVAREKSWHNIGLYMYSDWTQLDAEKQDGRAKDLKKKWRHIRDNYIKHINQGRHGSPPSKRKKYVYADMLVFLLETTEKRPKSGELSVNSSVQGDVDDEEEEGEGEDADIVNYCEIIDDIQDDTLDLNVQQEIQDPLYVPDKSSQEEIHDPKDLLNKSTQEKDQDVKDPRNKSYQMRIQDPKYLQNRHNQKKIEEPKTKSKKFSPFQTLLLQKLDNNSKIVDEDHDRHFLLSLLPDFKKLNEDEKLEFKLMNLQFLRSARQHNSRGSSATSAPSAVPQPWLQVNFPLPAAGVSASSSHQYFTTPQQQTPPTETSKKRSRPPKDMTDSSDSNSDS